MGSICALSYPIATVVLFVRKAGSLLYLIIDYYSINIGIIKNYYLLPLI
jgi:hypothetical protein